ncbi:hypothetical protein ACFL36_00465 [Thermodesulfobacteriota bacterium]
MVPANKFGHKFFEDIEKVSRVCVHLFCRASSNKDDLDTIKRGLNELEAGKKPDE